MAATTTEGTGFGQARKTAPVNEIAVLANAPTIIFTGIVAAEEEVSSPPSASNIVTFPYVLTGDMDNYVIMLTTINAGYAYVSDRDEDSDGNFSGFSFVVESEGDVMYLVAKVGVKLQ